jgi:Tol biopolymer transport system component
MSAPTDSFAPYGHQDGIVYFFATQDGGVAGVADRRDGSPIQIFAIASSGATTLLTRIAGADFAAVSPDGKHVAYTKDAGRGGAFLLDASTGRTLALPDSTVVGFAPDAAAVALRPLSEASTLAVDMSGQTVKRVDAVLTAWVASP